MTAPLFIITAALWGGGALMTALQAGIVPAPVSVAYRMAAAGLILLAWAALRGGQRALARHDLPWIAAQGVLFLGVNFIAFYEAARLIPSGLAALVLSTSSVMAALIGHYALGLRMSGSMMAGACLGVVGVGLISGHSLNGVVGAHAVEGLLWAALAAASTAIGTIIGARNQRQGLPTLPTLGWGALAGALFAALWATAESAPFVIDLSPRYLLSFAYLTIAASCVAFMLYFELVRRLGPGQAAYSLALTPVIALVLSSLFEGLVLDGWIFAGAAVTLAGNILILRKPAPARPEAIAS